MVDLVCKKPYGWIPTVVSTYACSFTNQIQLKMWYGDMRDMLIAAELTKM